VERKGHVLRAEKKGKVGFSGLLFFGYFFLEEQKKVTLIKISKISDSFENMEKEILLLKV
jgi:hypothetical protein